MRTPFYNIKLCIRFSSHVIKFIDCATLLIILNTTYHDISRDLWCIFSIGSVNWLRLLSLLCQNCFIHKDPLSSQSVSLALQKDRLERRGVKTTLGFTMTKQAIRHFVIFT